MSFLQALSIDIQVKMLKYLISQFNRYLPREVDPLVYNMSHEDPGDITYSDVGGLSEQIRELREVLYACQTLTLRILCGILIERFSYE